MQTHPDNDSPKTSVAGIIAQKNVNQGKPPNLCYAWERHGECKRGDSCPFSHPEANKGTKKVPGGAGAQPTKTTGRRLQLGQSQAFRAAGASRTEPGHGCSIIRREIADSGTRARRSWGIPNGNKDHGGSRPSPEQPKMHSGPPRATNAAKTWRNTPTSRFKKL